MIYFKGCPRCHGDINLAEDMFGKYLNCLQCGYMRDLAELKRLDSAEAEDPLVVEERELQAA